MIEVFVWSLIASAVACIAGGAWRTAAALLATAAVVILGTAVWGLLDALREDDAP